MEDNDNRNHHQNPQNSSHESSDLNEFAHQQQLHIPSHLSQQQATPIPTLPPFQFYESNSSEIPQNDFDSSGLNSVNGSNGLFFTFDNISNSSGGNIGSGQLSSQSNLSGGNNASIHNSATNISTDQLISSFDFGACTSFSTTNNPISSLQHAISQQQQQQQQQMGMNSGYETFTNNTTKSLSNNPSNNMIFGMDGNLNKNMYNQQQQQQQAQPSKQSQQHANILPLPLHQPAFISSNIPLISQQKHVKRPQQAIQPAPPNLLTENMNNSKSSMGLNGNTSSGATTMTASTTSSSASNSAITNSSGAMVGAMALPPGSSAEEKAAFHRERNRQHARSTRARKKAYVNKLKVSITDLG